MATKWLNRALLGAGLLALSTTGAWALPVTLTVVGQGIVATNLTYGCPTGSVNCLASADFSLAAPAAATGTIGINAAGTIASIDLHVASATFDDPVALVSVTFAGVDYTGDVAIQTFGPGLYFQNVAVLSSGTVDGTANTIAFTRSPGISNLNCAVVGGAGQCGFTFGSSGFTNVSGQDWAHTFNVTVIPEPASALLVALGMLGSLLRARRA